MSHVIKELKAIQEGRGYLPLEELEALSRRLRLPLYELQAVASFYPHFRLEPPPRLEVLVCQDVSCHLAGAPEVRAAVERACATEPGVVVRGTSCLGRCERPTAIAVDHEILGGLDAERARRIVEGALASGRAPRDEPPAGPRFAGLDPYGETKPGEALSRLLHGSVPEAAIEALKASGLRGMGGAGFPTGTKWELVRKAAGGPKYVVCNADESEPGTFKDRVVLESHARLVLEGMAIAGVSVGAAEGIVYIRHEYARGREALERAMATMRAERLLGPDLLGTGQRFEVEIFVSPGGYICGEETALLEALEGKRAEPRNKPPFPGTHGLWGKPTLINNVETFAYVPAILLRGASWFRASGRNGAAGLKLLALSGHVRRPGVYEVPMGIPAAELIEREGGGVVGGRALKGFAPGGASSGFLPASLASTPLDFAALAKVGSMLGSGAVVAIADGTCMLDLALNATRFFRNESCGKCVPCRAGSEKLVGILEAAARGEGTAADLGLVEDLSEAMRETSICGLGQAAPYPVLSVVRHWREEVLGHVVGRRCPSGVCAVAGGRS